MPKGFVRAAAYRRGQLIGYVGSTGASTGPHLDYRVWRNGKPIDPLKIPQEPGEPIHKANRAAYEYVRDRIMAELDGKVKEEDKIKQLDSIVLTPSKRQTAWFSAVNYDRPAHCPLHRPTPRPDTGDRRRRTALLLARVLRLRPRAQSARIRGR